MRTRFLPVWLLAVALIGAGWWQGNHDAARASTTYYVTNNLDDGTANSLRQAVNSATDGDEIHIVTPGPIVLTAGQLNITKSITIEGPDILVDPTTDPTTQLPAVTGQVAIEGTSPNGSVISISSGKSVSLSHLFITNGTVSGPSHATGTGDDAFGGGINNAGNLTLDYCTVANNGVHGGDAPDGGGAAYGGGIYSSGTLTLNYSTVRNNLAQGGTGTNAAGSLNAAYGGGIYSTGTTNINSSYIADNQAFGGGNASTAPVLPTTNGGSAFGGGLAQKDSGTLNLTNSTVYGNLATSGTGSTNDGNAQGAGVYIKTAAFNPLQVTIAGNTVTGAITSGGGVSYTGAVPLDVNNSIIADNSGAVNDLDASPSFVAHNSPGINVAVSLSAPSADQYSPTYAIQSTDGTYVVDQGDNTLAASLSFDQRGYARKNGPRVDAGAVESASAVPTHTGATNLSAFHFQILNNASYFSAADFTNSLTYSDPNASLKAIVITAVPLPGVGYFELNGQQLTKGSVISIDDLDKLTYVSNNGSTVGSLSWQASDGSTLSTTLNSKTPSYLPSSPGYYGGTDGDGTTAPHLSTLNPVATATPGVYTITTIESSSAAVSGNYQVAISATVDTGSESVTNPLYTVTSPAPGPVSGNSTVTLTVSSPGTHVVVITATDIKGNMTSKQVVFDTDSSGAVQNYTSGYGGTDGNGSSSPTLAVNYNSILAFTTNIIPDGSYPVYATVTSNAKLGTGTASQVTVSVSGDGASISPAGAPTFSNASGAASGTATITLNVSSGVHLVYVIATDINGHSTRYSFSYLGDAAPAFQNKAVVQQTYHIPYGGTYTANVPGFASDFGFEASDGDYKVPNIPSMLESDNLRFQVDQEGYASITNGVVGTTQNIKQGNIGTFGSPTVTGNPGTQITSPFSWTPTQPGKYTLRLSLTDYWALGDNFTFSLIVDSPTAPTWTGPGTLVAQYHDPSFSLNLNDYVTGLYAGNIATSTPAATPKYSVISGLPAWADFNPTTGVISGTPTAFGNSNVQVTVDDGLGNVVTNVFTIQVINGAPVVDSLTPSGGSPVTSPSGSTINFTVGQPINIAVAAHDPNGDSPITYGLTGWSTATIAKVDDNDATISSTGNLALSDVGSHPVTLTVSDGTNTTTVNFTIQVTNGNAPVITNKSSIQGGIINVPENTNYILSLSATDADPGDTLTFSANTGTFTNENPTAGNPGSPKSADYNLLVTPGSHSVTITVKDVNLNSDSVTFTVIGGNGTPPDLTLSPTGPTFSAVTGSPIPTIKATATDPDDPENLTFTLSGAPSGMTLSSPSSFTAISPPSPKSVTLQWTPTSSQAGSYSFNVIVTDSSGFQKSVPVTINVTLSSVNHKPNVVNPITLNGYVNVPFTSYQILATDPDGDNIASYTATNLPPGLTMTSSGLIQGTPTTAGTYNNVTVNVTDDSLLGPMTTTITFTINVTTVNPPILNRTGTFAFSGSPYNVATGASFIKQFQATDKDYPETLTFTATYSDDNGVTNTPLPSTDWSLFSQNGNSATGTTATATLTWNNVPAGVHVVTVTVTDGGGNTDAQTFTVQSGNAPQLTLSSTDTITVLAGNPLPPLTATAKDADANENLSFTLEGAPSGMTLSNPSSFSSVPANTATSPVSVLWTPTSGDVGTHTFNMVVTDAAGLRATQPVTIIVAIPGVPTLSTVANPITLYVGDVFTNTFTSTDTDTGDTLTFNAETYHYDSAAAPPNNWVSDGVKMLLDQGYDGGPPTKASALLTWNATAIGNYRVDVSVTDSQGHKTIQSIYINVVNSPITVQTPADQTVSVGTALTPLQISVTSSVPVTYSMTGNPSWLHIDTATGIITGTPGAGDVGTSSISVKVSDGTNPAVPVMFKVIVVAQGVPTLNATPAINSPVTLNVNQVFTNNFTSNDSDANDTLTFSTSTTTLSGTGTGSGSLLDQSFSGTPTTTKVAKLSWSANAVGTYQVTVKVTDAQGHSTPQVIFFNVVNSPPVVVNPGAQSASIGTAYDLQIQATDPDSDPLTFSVTGLPSSASWQMSATGEITGTPTVADVGPHTVKVTVDDGVNTPVTVTFQLTVADQGVPTLNATPSISSPVTLSVNQIFTNNFTSNDSDANDTLTFSTSTTTLSGTGTGTGSLLDQGYSGTPTTTKVAQLSWSANAPGTYQVSVKVTDSQGHTTTQVFYVNIANGPPVVVNPGAQSASIGTAYDLQIQATDPDSDPLTFSVTGLPSSASWQMSATGEITGTPTVADVGPHTVKVTVDDGVNTPVTVTFQLTVADQGVPTLNATPSISSPVTLSVNQIFTNNFTSNDSDANDTLTFSVTDIAPPGVVTSSFADQSYSGTPTTSKVSQLSWSADTPGMYQERVDVTDSQGHVTSLTYYFKVTAANAPPVVQNPGSQIAAVGSFYTLSITATDAEHDTLTYSSSNLPAWASLDSSLGIISGTPGVGDVGTTNVTVSVSDGVNTPVSVTFSLQVVASGVPTLSATPTSLGTPEQITLGQGYSRIFLANDSDYPETLTFSVNVTPLSGGPGNTSDAAMVPMYESGSASTGTIVADSLNWTPDTAGTYQVVVSVTDHQGHVSSLTFSIHVSSPPTISVTPTTISAIPGLAITPIPVQVSDPDNNETLSVSLGSNAPSGMTVKSPSTFSNVASNTSESTELDFTPTSDQANTSYTFNVIVTDNAGLTATQSVTVNVGAVNAAPVIVSPTSGSTKNVVTGHQVSLPVVATDVENNTLTYAATGLPAGLSIDSSTGIISGTVTAGAGDNIVTVTVKDIYHTTPTTVIFNISVGTTNHAPTLATIPDQTLIIGQTLNIQPVGSDPDNDVLTYSFSSTPVLPTTSTLSGLSMPDTSTGLITGTGATEGTWTVTVTAADNYTGTASQTFTLTVKGPFSVTSTADNGYQTITYTVTNTTNATVNPVVRGNLTGAGYTDNANAFFYASKGSVSDQWASPIIQRQLDPTMDTRILTWTVGTLAPGASATLTISVPISGSTPAGTQLTNTWTESGVVPAVTVSPVQSP